MTPSEQTRANAAKITREFPNDHMGTWEARPAKEKIAKAIEAMPLPAESAALAALADDMAKALAEGINYQQQMGILPKWGRDVLTEMRAALDRFRAAKKE